PHSVSVGAEPGCRARAAPRGDGRGTAGRPARGLRRRDKARGRGARAARSRHRVGRGRRAPPGRAFGEDSRRSGPNGGSRVSIPSGSRIRAGVVGAGHMGQYHILAMMELWDVDLVGIADTDVDKAGDVAAKYGVRAFPDHRELAELV